MPDRHSLHEVIANQNAMQEDLRGMKNSINRNATILYGDPGNLQRSPGLVVRVDRIEQLLKQVRWLIVVVPPVAFMLVDLLMRILF